MKMEAIGLDTIQKPGNGDIGVIASAYIKYRDNISAMMAQMHQLKEVELPKYDLDDSTLCFVHQCIELERMTLLQARSIACKWLDDILAAELVCRKILDTVGKNHELYKQYLDISLEWIKANPTGDTPNPASQILEQIHANLQHATRPGLHK
ncbi:hypothetical protein H7170_03490 [Candidatus Gracilibacteria bacterium]|nr:hypothetical protein [Candidatus Gracilibacteria bacterium]